MSEAVTPLGRASDPEATFAPRFAIVSPHIDDETLGCGALIARLAATREIHVVFATDSSRSPEHPDGLGADPASLAAAREREAVAAMRILGVPADRLHFLRFPDGQLSASVPAFRRALSQTLCALGEMDVLVPFRYDWHKDHAAVHAAATAAFSAGEVRGRLVEYFVYTQRRLLPGGDVRAYLQPSHTIRVATNGVADLKLRALECFRSQTTIYFDWQKRPILTPELLRRMCADPESFLLYDPEISRVLRHRTWVRLANALEPSLKRIKDDALAWVQG